MSDLSLTVERTINARQEDVFNAWLNPDMLRKFMMPAPGMSVAKAANDPRKGGRFDIVMQAGENEIPHSGTYFEIDPYDRIVFSWESPFSADGSTVTLAFEPADQGTRITLTHIRFTDAETRDNHEGGWNGILDALDSAMS